jgi:hypothetical protein
VGPDASGCLADPSADLEQLEPQFPHLGLGQFRVMEMFSEQPGQTVGGSMKKEPELIGQKTVAT